MKIENCDNILHVRIKERKNYMIKNENGIKKLFKNNDSCPGVDEDDHIDVADKYLAEKFIKFFETMFAKSKKLMNETNAFKEKKCITEDAERNLKRKVESAISTMTKNFEKELLTVSNEFEFYKNKSLGSESEEK